jgi:hypothetical protein
MHIRSHATNKARQQDEQGLRRQFLQMSWGNDGEKKSTKMRFSETSRRQRDYVVAQGAVELTYWHLQEGRVSCSAPRLATRRLPLAVLVHWPLRKKEPTWTPSCNLKSPPL